MVVWHSPCESRTLPGTQHEKPRSMSGVFYCLKFITFIYIRLIYNRILSSSALICEGQHHIDYAVFQLDVDQETQPLGQIDHAAIAGHGHAR